MVINPNDGFKASITRVFHTNGVVVGAGFLVSGQYVLTCAHVVTAALGISNNTTEAPTGSIDLDFPLVAPGQKIKAQVVFWQPMNSSAIGEDIAGLKLEGELPNDAQPVRLVTADELWAHPIRIFGFPSGHTNGVWASGVLRDKLANAWVQIEDDKVTGLRVERGFSGAPVWDETLAGVVGMAVAAETQRQEGKVAFIIPTKVLSQAWSILGQSVDVGGKQPLEQGIGSNPILCSPEQVVPEVKSLNKAGIKNRRLEINTNDDFYEKRIAAKQEELAKVEADLDEAISQAEELKLNKKAERLLNEIQQLKAKLS
ncbi:MAG: serine protease [Cyanobacteriota bacterium]